MTAEDTLLSDQVFQLNTFLWALEDLPKTSQTKPVLRQAGYYLSSIGRRVIMPVDEHVAAALQNLSGSADRSPCHPDLWLKHNSDLIEPLIELKARGFSPDSSNRKQALKLLAAAPDLAPSLGVPDERPGHVLYATISTDAEGLATTLKDLALALETEKVPAAPTGVIGLSVDADGVALSSPTPSDLPEPAAIALADPVIVLPQDGMNAIQPLYFIPWIPGIEGSQDPELSSDGLRELTARVLTHALAEVGQAQTPTTLTLDGQLLLNRATFGVFAHWRDADRKQFSEAAAKIVERALTSVVTVRRKAGAQLEIDLPDAEAQDVAIDRIERADPADPKASLETVSAEPATLFDQLNTDIT
ncbi:MAG: hypothetical protein KTV68_14360 [Acidimicrobiia bacterium]|nr:hypothetical protein [Acidimicrobiia bacterium]